MNIQALKIDIIHWLTELRDERVLEKIQGIRESTENVSLSASQKEELESRLESFENEPWSLRLGKKLGQLSKIAIMTNYSYKLSISAIDDLSKSYAWYEDKLSGLGERFLISMDNAFDTICINPTAFQVRFNSNVRGLRGE